MNQDAIASVQDGKWRAVDLSMGVQASLTQWTWVQKERGVSESGA